MKKERVFISSLCVLLIVLGLIFGMIYLNSYANNTRHVIPFVLALLAMAESLFVGLSLWFYLRGLKNKFAIIVSIVSIVLTVPVLLLALLWALYLVGIQILPPPQS